MLSDNIHLPGRTFFTTENGLYGLFLPGIRAGDEVTTWFDAATPFLLRHGNEFYRFVGGAYVGGVMAVETVDELYCDELLDSKTLLAR